MSPPISKTTRPMNNRRGDKVEDFMVIELSWGKVNQINDLPHMREAYKNKVEL